MEGESIRDAALRKVLDLSPQQACRVLDFIAGLEAASDMEASSKLTFQELALGANGSNCHEV